jgi:SAM-dependent methyltransferase
VSSTSAHAATTGAATGLELTGERTVPGIPRENYWFQRHLAVYEWIVRRGLAQGTVVEAGCGEGYGADLLASAGATIIALDYDEPVVSHVRRTYPGVDARVANLASLPLADQAADQVVSLQVIEHLWDLPAFLRDCQRVTRPGGSIVVSTPNRVTFSPGVGRGQKPTNPFHVEEFDAQQVHDLLVAAGFGRVEVRGLRHGPRITADEREHGSLVTRQIDAVLGDSGWSHQLLDTVAGVSTDDFEIVAVPVGSALHLPDLDLLAVGTRPGGRP